MKKTIIFAAAVAAAVSFTACNNAATTENKTDKAAVETIVPAGSIVFFDLDRVLEEYDMANDKRSEVETKVEAIQKEVSRRQKNLENAVKDFNNKINKGLMTSAVAAEQQKKLQQQDAAFQQFAQEKQNEIMEEQQVMMNQLAEAIKTFIESFNAEKGYAMILSNSNGVPVITGDSKLDITDAVIAGLNAEYVKTKSE